MYIYPPTEKHDYGYSKRAAMYMFFAYHLDLDLHKVKVGKGVEEDFVKILSQEELKVFTNENPRPDDAVLGDEAIIKYLNETYDHIDWNAWRDEGDTPCSYDEFLQVVVDAANHSIKFDGGE